MEDLDLESSSFDGQKYVASFLKRHSIQDLIKKNNTISKEIKDYDQEIQSLVFQNYSRFISSIDTVKKMNTDIFSVDSKMKKLEESMNRITSLAKNVDSSMSIKRNEISKLNTVKIDLEKLKVLCMFPEILAEDLAIYNQMVANSNVNYASIFDKSLQSYGECFTQLVEFQEDPLVKPIYKDSIEKVEEIRSILWKAQNSFKANSILTKVQPLSNQVNSVNSLELRLVTLKLAKVMVDQEAMLRNYLKIMKNRFTSMITDLANSTKQTSKSTKDFSYGERQEKFLDENNHKVNLEEFGAFYKGLENEVVSAEVREEGTVIWLVNEFVSKGFTELEIELDFIFNNLPLKSESFPLKDELIEQTVKEICSGIIEEIKKRMAKKMTNIEVSECLKELSQCLRRVILSNKSLKRSLKTNISDKFSELAEKEYFKLVVRQKQICLEAQEKYLSKPLETSTAKELSDIESNIGKELNRIVVDFSSRFTCLIQWTCLELRSLLFSEVQFLRTDEMFITLVNQSMIDFVRLALRLLSLRTHSISQESIASFEQASSLTTKEIQAMYAEAVTKFQATKESSLWMIFSARTLANFEEKGIQKVFETLEQANKAQMKLLCAQQPALAEFDQSENQSIHQHEIPILRTICRRDSSLNYVNYSQFITEQILTNVIEYFQTISAEGSQSNTKRNGESISKEVISSGERIRQVVIEINLLFPDARRQLATKGSFVREDTAGMMMDMERLIVKKSHAFETDKLDFNRGTLLLSIARATVKTLIEKVRKIRWFSDATFKQIQIDLFFFVQILYEIVSVDEESYIVASYYEMIESAKDSSQSVPSFDPAALYSKTNSQRTALKW